MKDCKIKSLSAREILNSKGEPAVEVELKTDAGIFFASAPSGTSRGKYEAVELRDDDGKGVKKAIENIEKIISPALEKEELADQKRIDEILIQSDGTKNKSALGANAILPVSIAVCRAGAAAKEIPLYKYISEISGTSFRKMPTPSFNLLEGGKHADSGLAFQEFMAIPQKGSFKENLEIGKKTYKTLGKILQEKFGKKKIGTSQEGAFSAPIAKITDAFDFILAAAEVIGFKEDIKIAIDAAASEFLKEGFYSVDGKEFSKQELLAFYESLAGKYPMVSIEDPFSEEDFEGFSLLKETIGDKVIVIGDDLTVSNAERIKMAEQNKSCSGLLLKPNQIGTVSETLEAARLAASYGWKIMVSNRGGETQDSFIADLAVGIGADFIKSGAPFPKERMAKYDRLAKIEEELRSAN